MIFGSLLPGKALRKMIWADHVTLQSEYFTRYVPKLYTTSNFKQNANRFHESSRSVGHSSFVPSNYEHCSGDVRSLPWMFFMLVLCVDGFIVFLCLLLLKSFFYELGNIPQAEQL